MKRIDILKINTGNAFTMVIMLLCCLMVSCKKYLDLKPVQTRVTPTTVGDLQALLDMYRNMNQNGPRLLEALADNYYVNTATYNGRGIVERNNYVWDKDASDDFAWTQTYTKPVYIANVVLDQLPVINVGAGEQADFKALKGSALYHRAFAFYELAQLWCRPFSPSAETDPGIVLRLTSNIDDKSVRSTVKETYDRIINDLQEAVTLLPETNIYPTRPSKIAAYGALARVYLSMRDYENAGKYAGLYLGKKDELIDYNTLVPSATFPLFNKEVTFYNMPGQISITSGNQGAKVDSTLYRSYVPDDLRKVIFFKENTGINAGTQSFKGGYEGSVGFSVFAFDGICTDEMYLVRAEARARSGETAAALQDLNALLITRWKTGTFIPFTASNADDALDIILTERRKELLYRGLRWTDIRRLNLDGANISLERVIDGVSYKLPANDPRFVLLIPKEVINLTNLPQNPR